MTGANPHEQQRRAEKAEQLVAAIAADQERRGLTPNSPAALREVEQAGDATWFRWWTAAKCASAPSEATKALVVAMVRLSAECGAEIERAAKTQSPQAIVFGGKSKGVLGACPDCEMPRRICLAVGGCQP